jgi:hypothetical protein
MKIFLIILTGVFTPIFTQDNAQALTWEEAARFFGVIQRYADDINRSIIVPQQQNNQSAPPNTEPQVHPIIPIPAEDNPDMIDFPTP